MAFERPLKLHFTNPPPSPPERVVVVTEDPAFWFALRREAPEIDSAWILTHTARECLLAVEDQRVQVLILDGALNDKPANQLMKLVKQIRPNLRVVFAYQSSREDWEREAREAGVLYYGDRAQPADMVRVVCENIRCSGRPRPHRRDPSSGGGA